MKIIQLTTENIKRVKAVHIEPDGSLVIVGGKNAQGKTSVLDSIMYALAGKRSIPDRPLREGASKGKVEVDLGQFVVTANFSQKGNTITVKNADGLTYPSPQKMLDALVGKLTFDPLEFMRMEPKKQLEVVRELTGLNFDEHDRKRKELFDERTMVNRRVNEIQGQITGMKIHEDVPGEEVSAAEISKQLQAASMQASRIQIINSSIEAHERSWKEKQAQVIRLLEEIETHQTKVKELREDLQSIEILDPEPLQEQLANIETINAKVRENKKREEVRAELRKHSGRADELTETIEGMDAAKKDAIASAKLPVDNLTFDSDGLMFQGVPFDQASGAEKLRVSVAMGIAANPKLKVLLIRDGSLLDDDNLKMVAEMAEQAEAQVWLERVGEGAECSVIIEDGMIKEDKNVN